MNKIHLIVTIYLYLIQEKSAERSSFYFGNVLWQKLSTVYFQLKKIDVHCLFWLSSQKHFSAMFFKPRKYCIFWAFQLLYYRKQVTHNSIFNLTGDYKNIWCSLTVVTAIYYIKNKLILIFVKLKSIVSC